MKKNPVLRFIVLLGVFLLVSQPGYSQNSEPDETRPASLDEIIVTAERREQRLQDVPLSITAFGDEKREEVGIISIQDMSDFTPGFTYNTSSDRPSIRGVARQSNTFSLDSPVANYIDGIYTSSVQDAQRGPMFVERTEILRGPQGALSGRGSVAGAVNTYLKRPTDEFYAEVRTTAETYALYGGAATISGPVTDWLRLRLNLTGLRQDEGYFDNVANGTTEGDQPNNRQAADYMWEADITDDLEWYFKASFTEYDETRRSTGSTAPYVADVIGLPATPYGYLGSPLTPDASYGYFDPTAEQVGNTTENPVITTGDYRKYNNNYRSRQWLDDHHNYTSHLTWYTGAVDVKWIAGHQNYIYTQRTDGDFTPINTMTLSNDFTAFGVPERVVNARSSNTYREEREWFSNEITIASAYEGPVQWVAGVYQSVEDYNQEPFTLTHEGYQELANPIAYTGDYFAQLPLPEAMRDTSGWDPNGAIANTHGRTSVYGYLDGETTSSAVFGQIDYQVSDMWKFTLGARYNKDEKNIQEQTRYVGNNFGVGAGQYLAGGVPVGGLDSGVAALDATPLPETDPAEYPEGVYSDYIDPNTGRRVRDLEAEWDAVTGTVGVDFTPTDDMLVFFRVASGYRPGGFDAGFLADSPQVDEETLISYELGYKSTIANQLQLSTTVFYYDFQDQQLDLPTLGRCTDPNDLNTCTIVDNFFNIPQSESIGFELEANWQATENLNLLLSYGYLNATIKDGLVDGKGFQNPEDPAAILPSANRYQAIPGQFDEGYTEEQRWLQDLSGNKVADSPEHKVAVNASYVVPFSAGDLVLSAKYAWRDDSYSDVFETEQGVIDGFGTVGVRALWKAVDDRYSIIVYGENVTDEVARDGGGLTRLATSQSGAAGQQFYETYNLIPPRIWGVQLQYRFTQ